MTYGLIRPVLRSCHLVTPSWHKMANNQPTSTVFVTNQKRSRIGGEFNRYLITRRRCLYLIRYAQIERQIYGNSFTITRPSVGFGYEVVGRAFGKYHVPTLKLKIPKRRYLSLYATTQQMKEKTTGWPLFTLTERDHKRKSDWSTRKTRCWLKGKKTLVCKNELGFLLLQWRD